MNGLDRKAAEFRALQESIQVRLRGVDLTRLGKLSKSLSIQEFRSLEFLNASRPPKMSELAEFLGLAANSVTDIVDGLERRGLARRRRNDADRRVVHVELTDAGRSAAETVVNGVLKVCRTYLDALTEAEQDTLLELYRKIARIDLTVE